jgi:hypothetical protein
MNADPQSPVTNLNTKEWMQFRTDSAWKLGRHTAFGACAADTEKKGNKLNDTYTVRTPLIVDHQEADPDPYVLRTD